MGLFSIISLAVASRSSVVDVVYHYQKVIFTIVCGIR